MGTKAMDTRISRKIQYISLLLAINVVFIHTYNVEVYQLTSYNNSYAGILVVLEKFFNTMQLACVPFFFVLSGYLFFRNYTWLVLEKKYISRVKTLVIPFILWNTLYFILFAVLTRLPMFSSHMNMPQVELSLSHYVDSVWNSSYTVLWFLRTLVTSIIFAPVLYGIIHKKSTPFKEVLSCIGTIILLIYCVVCLVPFDSPLDWMRHVGSYLNAYFVLGAILGLRFQTFVENKGKIRIGLGIVGLILCVLLRTRIPFSDYTFLWNAIIIISIWFVADLGQYKKEASWWQKQTFFIYCAHSFILEGMEKLWLIVAGQQIWAAAFDYFVLPFVVIALIIGIAYFMNRFLRPVYAVLTGNRGGK